jgi:aldose sugar dehydrogenase
MSKTAKIMLGVVLALLIILAVVLTAPRPTRRDADQPPAPESGRPPENGDSGAIETTVVAEDLEIPWSLAFLPDGAALFAERPGRLRFMSRAGRVREEPVARIKVNHEGEGGLLGVAMHPDFADNGYVYLYFTYRSGGRVLNRVDRYRFDRQTGSLGDRDTIIAGIPGAGTHNGGRIKFGPDDKLYVTTGDAQQPDLSQERASLAGKILRLEDDGDIPEDNPLSDSPVYALGLRNPQGLAWQPGTGRLYVTDHGPEANDHLYRIKAGGNYGWPEVREPTQPGFEDPILSSGNQTWAPSGMAFYTGRNRQFNDSLFFAALRGRHLRRVVLAGDGQVEATEALFEGEFGRVRDVVSGPDGSLYLLTSNQDGRGVPAAEDDRIIKMDLGD